MDHVIEGMKEWLRAFDHECDGYKNSNAIECIQNALKELEKYYTHYDNEEG